MMFGKISPIDRARAELEELDREEYTLRKNMMHDRHRLAYIKARRRQLKADHPPVVQPKTSTVIRWLGRAPTPPPVLTDELLPWVDKKQVTP